MASPSRTAYTHRDQQILQALLRTPLTAEQIRTFSECFATPFTKSRPVRRRLQRLAAAGWVRCERYASSRSGATNYYQLTPTGYRLLNGPKATLPGKHFFAPVSLALQQHTQALADFIVHTTVGAHRAGLRMTGFYRENELKLSLGDERMSPDNTFQLLSSAGQALNYVVELDNGSEPLCSTKERDSLARKVAFYDRYQDITRHRFRILLVFAKQGERLNHFLDIAANLVRNPQRRLFYAVFLPDYLRDPDPLRAPLFRDHDRRLVPLVPTDAMTRPASQQAKSLDPAAIPW